LLLSKEVKILPMELTPRVEVVRWQL
jgi:hypothetical protein